MAEVNSAHLPLQVRQQIKRANELQAELASQGGDPPAPAPAEPEVPPIAEPPNPDLVPPKPDVEEPGAGGHPEPEPPAPSAASEADEWKRRYDALRGKYDAEVPRLSTQVNSLQTQVTQLLDQLVDKKQEVRGDEPDPGLAQYGEDLTGFIQRQAEKIADKQISSLKADIKFLRAKLEEQEQGTERSAEAKFHEGLNAKLSGWREQNLDQGFIGWLADTPHPDYPGSYKDVLDTAVRARDVDRVVRVFLAYPRARATPLGRQATSADTPPPRDTAPRPMDTALAPPRGRASQHREPAEKPTVTREEIRAFHTDVTARRLTKADEDKWRKIIDSAIAEGRVV